ncbi:MAG: hypothetical protein ACI9F9_000420 [Candidatus Paceibacteria bacterium]|jgi:hypothetical protein
MNRLHCTFFALLLAVGSPAANAQCEQLNVSATGGSIAISGKRAIASVYPNIIRFYEYGPIGWELSETVTTVGQIFFPNSVALDGNTALVSNPEATVGGLFAAGRTYVYEHSGAQWTRSELIVPSTTEMSFYGSALAIDGERAVVGAIHAFPDMLVGDYLSRAYVFEKVAGSWQLVQELMPNPGGDFFGVSLAIEGDTLVAGASLNQLSSGPLSGSAYVYERTAGTWQLTAQLDPLVPVQWQGFGESVALAGDTLFVGASNDYGGPPGFVEVFERQAGSWQRTQHFESSVSYDGDRFGLSLAVSDGTLLVGAPGHPGTGAGAIHRFERSGGLWQEVGTFTNEAAPNSMGRAVAIDGNAAIGSTLDYGGYTIFYSLGIADGGNYCTATVNSTGMSASISIEGCDSLSGNQLTLSASSVPPGSMGLFLFGPNRVQVPLDDGFRCVGTPFYRLSPLHSNAQGILTDVIDFSSPSANHVTPGTWYFQAYYRDLAAGASGANLSDGARVELMP